MLVNFPRIEEVTRFEELEWNWINNCKSGNYTRCDFRKEKLESRRGLRILLIFQGNIEDCGFQ